MRPAPVFHAGFKDIRPRPIADGEALGMKHVFIAAIVVSAVVLGGCTGKKGTPVAPGVPEPFTATFPVAGPYHLNDVNAERFDFAGSPESTDSSLANKHVDITSITVTGTGISNTDFAEFDVEVHLHGTTIGLPTGQKTFSAMNPDTGVTRTAKSQLWVVPFRNTNYNGALSANVDMGFKVDFAAPGTTTSTPPLYRTKSTPVTSLDLTDGLHMQLFLWTGSIYTDALFRNLTVTVKGTAS
jgi:hypothetical protein